VGEKFLEIQLVHKDRVSSAALSSPLDVSDSKVTSLRVRTKGKVWRGRPPFKKTIERWEANTFLQQRMIVLCGDIPKAT